MTTGPETPKSRKRGRPRADEGESHRATPGKKPRLSISKPASSTPKTRKSATSAISGPLNYGHPTAAGRRGQSNEKNESVDHQAREISDSEDERQSKGSLPKKGQPNGRGVRSSAGKKPDCVYEFPGSDDELSTPAVDRTQTSKNSQDRHRPVTSTQEGSVPKKRGRPKRSTTLDSAETHPEGTSLGETTPKQRPARRSAEVSANGAVPDNDLGASGREADRRFGSLRSPNCLERGEQGANEPNTEPRKLKGILTPRKMATEDRRRKSVAFKDGKEGAHAEVYFEDLPSKPVKAPAQSARKSTVVQPVKGSRANTEADEDDDEVCTICSKPDSAPPNEILFCDGCDMAVHQVCYGVSIIPEGDWLCRGCSQDDAVNPQGPASQKMLAPTVKSEDQAPDIPNFEQHLRSMQRVLLDRCTGRRRIKLRGEDEAYDKATQLIEQTIVAGEGNSMLVIGARGSGKTTVGDIISGGANNLLTGL